MTIWKNRALFPAVVEVTRRSLGELRLRARTHRARRGATPVHLDGAIHRFPAMTANATRRSRPTPPSTSYGEGALAGRSALPWQARLTSPRSLRWRGPSSAFSSACGSSKTWVVGRAREVGYCSGLACDAHRGRPYLRARRLGCDAGRDFRPPRAIAA